MKERLRVQALAAATTQQALTTTPLPSVLSWWDLRTAAVGVELDTSNLQMSRQAS